MGRMKRLRREQSKELQNNSEVNKRDKDEISEIK